MKTVIWKAQLAEGKQEEFTKTYEMFKEAKGFVSAEFFHLTDEDSTIIVVESWESEELQMQFMWSLNHDDMNNLFSLLASKPEAWNCEIGEKIVK